MNAVPLARALRYLRLLRRQVAASVLLALQYRADFVLDGFLSLLRSAATVVPLLVVFRDRDAFAGWTFAEALLVMGWFMLLRGIIEGAISPSLTTVVDHIRKGTLDFVLLKPADAQFLVSTSRFELWPVARLVSAGVIFGWAFHLIGRPPSPVGVLLACALLVTSTLVLYSLWILTVSAAFYVVKVDNMIYLFDSIFDAARWPASIFKGVLEVIVTFVIPLAILTTFPAEALLGRLGAAAFWESVAGAVGFGLAARFVWTRSLSRYTSASS